jgi:voltage-gated potassium channel
VTIRAWFDHQLNVQSWQKPGLSPLNIGIIGLIVLSAALFAVETEQDLAAIWGVMLLQINIGILLIFACEFFLRLWSSGETKGITGLSRRFHHAEPGWLAIDFIAFAPELVLLLVLFLLGDQAADWVVAFKLVRLLRLAKLAHYLPGSRILLETVASVWGELLASVSIAATLIFVSAVLIHFAEAPSDPRNFGSVLRSLWWAIVTLTTVGYGDVVPHTPLGRVIAGLVAVIGVGLVALPSGIIAGAFIERLRAERMKRREADEETSE